MSLIMVLATPARSGPIPHRRGDEESRGNHPGEQVVRLLTIHPIRRKPHGQHSSASDDHTGTTKAWPPHGDRIEDKTMKSNGAPPFTKSGKGTRTCVQTSTPDAPHRIEYQIKLH
jgi:hypothetical protein